MRRLFSFLVLLTKIGNIIASEQSLFKTYYTNEIAVGVQGEGTTHLNCSSAGRCSHHCLQDTTCESAIYNSSGSTCTLYRDALMDLVESSSKTHLLYLESVCAVLLDERHSTCPTLNGVRYKDCQEYFEKGYRSSGVYQLKLPGLHPFDVWCDFDSTNSWTVIQRRQDGSVDFFLYWDDYKNGFGNVDGEYWLGNDGIHALTQTNQKLHIYLEAADGSYRNGYWSQFYIADESDNYRLTVSANGYNGDADETLSYTHNGKQFTTRDRDNDDRGPLNCAVAYSGAWWYNSCHDVCLNGPYSITGHPQAGATGVTWCCSWKGHGDSLLKATMSVSRD